MKTSYRTVLFGAVMFVCAAAPTLADSVPAVPKATTTSTVTRAPMDSVPAVPKAKTSTVNPPQQTAPVLDAAQMLQTIIRIVTLPH